MFEFGPKIYLVCGSVGMGAGDWWVNENKAKERVKKKITKFLTYVQTVAILFSKKKFGQKNLW